jgi:hypothetical protein
MVANHQGGRHQVGITCGSSDEMAEGAPCRSHVEGCFKGSHGSGSIVPEAALQGWRTHVRSGEPAL